jgi:hypothetical protein
VIAEVAKFMVYPAFLDLKAPPRPLLTPIDIICVTVNNPAVAYPWRACTKKSLYFLYLVDIPRIATAVIIA